MKTPICNKCNKPTESLTVRRLGKMVNGEFVLKATMRRIPFFFCSNCDSFQRDVTMAERGWCPSCAGRTIKIGINMFACGVCEKSIKPSQLQSVEVLQ